MKERTTLLKLLLRLDYRNMVPNNLLTTVYIPGKNKRKIYSKQKYDFRE